MVDAKVSKTFDPKDHVGSTPSPGTEFRPRFHQRWKFSLKRKGEEKEEIIYSVLVPTLPYADTFLLP